MTDLHHRAGRPRGKTDHAGRPPAASQDVRWFWAVLQVHGGGFAAKRGFVPARVRGVHFDGCVAQLVVKVHGDALSALFEALYADGLAVAREAGEQLLNTYADAVTDPTRPDGCLLVQGALACSAEGEGIRSELAAKRRAGELALTGFWSRRSAMGIFRPMPIPQSSRATCGRCVMGSLWVRRQVQRARLMQSAVASSPARCGVSPS